MLGAGNAMSVLGKPPAFAIYFLLGINKHDMIFELLQHAIKDGAMRPWTAGGGI